MTDKLEYDVEDVICHQKRTNLYYDDGDQALDKVVDVHITGYKWQLIASWTNKSSSADTYSQEYSCGYTVTEGMETNADFEASAEFKGLGIKIGGSTKNFSSQETSTAVKYTQTVNVGPNSTVYFYQKRYTFKPEVWFILDAWNQHWTVGRYKSSGYAHVNQCLQIDSAEFLTTNVALSDKGTVVCTAQSGLERHDDYPIKLFLDCPSKCREYLHSRGV